MRASSSLSWTNSGPNTYNYVSKMNRTMNPNLIGSSFATPRACAPFSSSASSDLSKLLGDELQEEEGADEMPPELAELQESLSSDWRIVDHETNGTVSLYSNKTKGLVISFHCQDTLESPSELDEDEMLVDVEDEDEAAVAVRFTVTLTKAGKTMVLTCLSDMGASRVERVAMTNQDDLEAIQRNGIDESLYQGPEFLELNEQVQEGFHTFLQTDCGVNTDVASFIAMYADYKEQVEYMNFLNQVQGIL